LKMSRRGAAVDSDYDDDDEEEEEQQEDPISFDDRCKLVHVKSLALQSLAAVYPLLNTKTKKEHLSIITDCANDIADHLEQLQPPPPPSKRGRDEVDDDNDDEERFFSLSERAEHLGINLSDAQKKEAGLKVHIAYIDRYGRNPAKGGMAGGIKVNQYSENACERVMDPILKTYR